MAKSPTTKRSKTFKDILAAITELRKDCTYIIAVPEGSRDKFMQVLDQIDLSQGPQLLIVSDMDLTIMAFSKDGTEPPQVSRIKVGRKEAPQP